MWMNVWNSHMKIKLKIRTPVSYRWNIVISKAYRRNESTVLYLYVKMQWLLEKTLGTVSCPIHTENLHFYSFCVFFAGFLWETFLLREERIKIWQIWNLEFFLNCEETVRDDDVCVLIIVVVLKKKNCFSNSQLPHKISAHLNYLLLCSGFGVVWPFWKKNFWQIYEV